MGKPNLFIPSKVPQEVVEYLKAYANVEYHDEEEILPEEVFLNGLKKADGILIYSRNKINKRVLDQAPHLKAVCNIAVGFDNLDLAELTKKGIMATNTPGVLTETTADLAFSLLISVARRIPEANQYVKSGQWKGWLPSLMLGKDIHGSTLGIIGYGRIGSAISRRAKGFSMKVLYNNLTRVEQDEKELGIEYREIEDLLKSSDFVLIQVPLTPGTRKMIGEKEFLLMKNDAFFINASRGEVVDEVALIRALEEKKIAGAALDVFEKEPIPLDHPFMNMDNVVTLPHIGSGTKETRGKMAMKAAENMVQIIKGETPENLINTDLLQGKVD